MKHVLSPLFLLFFLGSTAFADVPAPEDFARGMILETDGGDAFFSIQLPAGLYRETVREDLGDIRIFNGAGETVPHSIKKPESTPISLHPPMPLPFFPICEGPHPAGDPEGEKVSLQINTAEDGTIINVQTGPEQTASKRLQAVILDLSHLDTAPAELVLEWNSGAESFVSVVSVDGSQDLTHWRPLVHRAGLAEQHFSGHTLYKNRILLPEPLHLSNYLRINWPVDAPDLNLKDVMAIFPETHAGPERGWCRIEGDRRPEAAPVFEFDTGGSFPVERLNLVLPEKNSLVRAVIQSRPDNRSKWRLRQEGLFYNLSVGETSITNDAVSITPVQDRYWRIEAASSTNGMGNRRPPQLEIGWIPHRLLFLARGEGPFTLAYGSGRIGPVDSSVENVLHEIEMEKQTAMIGKARAGRRFVLGGPAALEKSPLPVSWKTWVLWSVLVAGVALLGFLAFRLYRQMNGE